MYGANSLVCWIQVRLRLILVHTDGRSQIEQPDNLGRVTPTEVFVGGRSRKDLVLENSSEFSTDGS